jgi:hypothetical protein
MGLLHDPLDVLDQLAHLVRESSAIQAERLGVGVVANLHRIEGELAEGAPSSSTPSR